MDRKEFLRTCAGMFCSCSVAGALTPSEAVKAETKQQEDWRLPFIQTRYAKLIDILADKVSTDDLSEILRQLGYNCSNDWPLTKKYKGNIDGYIQESQRASNENIVYDREKGVITVTGPIRSDCSCPLVNIKTTSPKVCDCSLGWQQGTYETLLGKKVHVKFKESVLRGGQRCAFEIHIAQTD